MEDQKTSKTKVKCMDLDKINRVEIINHADNHIEKGRILTLYKGMKHFKDFDISIQDDGQTIKIFLT